MTYCSLEEKNAKLADDQQTEDAFFTFLKNNRKNIEETWPKWKQEAFVTSVAAHVEEMGPEMAGFVEPAICSHCGTPTTQEKCRVICRSEICRYRIVETCCG